ncbi:hypothetical protein ACQKLP_11580 [Chitinophaga sp. NPDC101104]|uniref:hypothetical protein n=1 Tax=Chitinophaga sp. NPDC101104 TaxID=3390561 RepID=UPI003CFE1359
MQMTLPLIRRKNIMIIRGLIFFGLIMLLFSIVDLIFSTGKMAIWSILGIASIGSAMLIRNYRIVGAVLLSTEEIVVVEQNASLKFPFQQIKDVILYLVDVKGKFNAINSISMNQGSGNSIVFSYEGVKMKVDFLLQEESVNSLGMLVSHWSKKKEMKIYNGANLDLGNN